MDGPAGAGAPTEPELLWEPLEPKMLNAASDDGSAVGLVSSEIHSVGACVAGSCVGAGVGSDVGPSGGSVGAGVENFIGTGGCVVAMAGCGVGAVSAPECSHSSK